MPRSQPIAGAVSHWLTATLLCLFTSALSAQRFSSDADKVARPFDEVLDEYRDLLERPSLRKRTTGRLRLAATRDPRALETLIKSYSRPEQPKEQVRCLIASIVMDAFGPNADRAMLTEWRQSQNKARDAWMWYCSQLPFISEDFATIRETLEGGDNMFLRHATLRALAADTGGRGATEEAAGLCLEMLESLPSKDIERALVIESCAVMALAARNEIRDDDWRPVAAKLIDQLDDANTPDRSVLTLSRYLAKIFAIPNQGFESRWWRSELERKSAAQRPRNHDTHTVPFFSIRTMGSRFVYVIDASDSMLQPVTAQERSTLSPITGAGQPTNEGDTRPDEDDLDWNRISTRFDVAREYLRRSLRSLEKNERFAVVLFGTKASLLDATPKLMPGSRKNVNAAIKELDSVRASDPTANRPNGTLRGDTNLHAGLRLAYLVTDAGVEKKNDYINRKGMMRGCDTILLLSDGSPSVDDWTELDQRDPWDQTGDPEGGTNFETDARILMQPGPYGSNQFILVDDVLRLNLFRRCEIHCVGIGEANAGMLRAIGEIGLGSFDMIENR